MSIFASAPVPAANRLVDADTLGLAAAAVGRFPVNSPYRPQDLAGQARRAWRAVQSGSVATIAAAAVTLDVPVAEVYELAVDHVATEQGWPGGVGRRPAADPDSDPAGWALLATRTARQARR